MAKWVKKLGVVGGGAMGQGIALQAALNGIHAVIKDASEELAVRAVAFATRDLGRYASRGLEVENPEEVFSNLSAAASIEDLKDCDLIIEAVPENKELKRKVFTELDRVITINTMFATNTSTIPVSELFSAMDPNRPFVGLHFFNPVPLMKLVEVIGGPSRWVGGTDNNVRRATVFVEQINRVPIVVRDVPGFLINRLLLPFLLEGFRVLQEWDLDFKDIDQEFKKHGYWPMGPFQLLDFVGLDVAFDAARVVAQDRSGDASLPEVFEWMYGQGRFGNKVGSGFYRVRESEPTVAERLAKAYPDRQYGPGPVDAYARMQAVFLREAVLAAQDRLTFQYRHIDEACKLGLNVKEGPLTEIRGMGLTMFLLTLEDFTERYGPRFSPPELLKRLVADGRSDFYYDGGV